MLAWQVALKEFKEILRNPVLVLLAFGVPVVFFFVFGFGINLDVQNLPVAVVDMDESKLSRDFADEIYNNNYFSLVGYMGFEDAKKLMRLNRLRGVVVIPPGFSRRLHEGLSSEVLVLVDGTYPYRADVTKGYMEAIVARFNRDLIEGWMKKRGKSFNLNLLRLDMRSLFNQSIKSDYSLVPGVFVIVLLINTTILASVAVVREKDYGTITNIYISSIGRASFILGKAFPYWLVGVANVFCMFVLSRVVFGIPFRGSFPLFFGASSIYVLYAALLGVLVSIFARTMIAAQIISMIVTVIPAFLYSGYLMPVSSLTESGRLEAEMLSASHYMNVCRGTFLKGLTFSRLASDIAAMTVSCIALFAISCFLFKKREG